MKNLLIRAVTLICGVTFQFALSMLIQLWTNYNPGYILIWTFSFVGWLGVVLWAFIEVNE